MVSIGHFPRNAARADVREGAVLATSRTNHLLARAVAPPDALTAGFNRALLACSIFLIAAAAIALRATNTRGEPAAAPALEAVPAAETI